jgi:hypothetical protein
VNDLTFVLRVELRPRAVAVGPGWGEELRGLAAPRPHGDVDLLYPAPGARASSASISTGSAASACRGQRAFVLDATMVELILVELEDGEWVTRLPGRTHAWPANVFAAGGRLPSRARRARRVPRRATRLRRAA